MNRIEKSSLVLSYKNRPAFILTEREVGGSVGRSVGKYAISRQFRPPPPHPQKIIQGKLVWKKISCQQWLKEEFMQSQKKKYCRRVSWKKIRALKNFHHPPPPFGYF